MRYEFSKMIVVTSLQLIFYDNYIAGSVFPHQVHTEIPGNLLAVYTEKGQVKGGV